MKIPKKIKIKNLTYKVRELTIDGDHLYGKANFGTQEISLDKDMGKERMEETLIHEIIHIILSEGKYNEEPFYDEKFVHFLTTSLHQVLKDNKICFNAD